MALKVSEEKDLLRVKDVARKLAVSVSKVYLLASTGRLVSVRVDGSVRFRPADVDRYIREHRSGGKDAA